MKSEWNISRTSIVRSDGQRRWDYTYQFLLRCAMKQETYHENSEPLNNQEDYNGDSTVCTCFDQPSTAETDD
jgi:hypothetical protein